MVVQYWPVSIQIDFLGQIWPGFFFRSRGGSEREQTAEKPSAFQLILEEEQDFG